MKRRGLLLLVAVAAGLLAWQGLAAAGADGAVTMLARSESKAPPSYRGAWHGTTAQGEEISFTVNRRNRVTHLEFGFTIQGSSCTVEVDKDISGSVASIKKKRFRTSAETANDSFTLTGRFTSRTAASGRIRATVEGPGCSGGVATTWRASKGPSPAAVSLYDGSWSGHVSLALDVPVVVAGVEDDLSSLSFNVVNGALTSMSVPAVAASDTCVIVRVPGLVQTFQPPVPIVNGTFSVSGEEGSDWRFAATGAFTSPTSASGTLRITGSLASASPFGGSCTATVEGTWQATKG